MRRNANTIWAERRDGGATIAVSVSLAARVGDMAAAMRAIDRGIEIDAADIVKALSWAQLPIATREDLQRVMRTPELVADYFAEYVDRWYRGLA